MGALADGAMDLRGRPDGECIADYRSTDRMISLSASWLISARAAGMDAGQVTGLAQPRSRRLDHVDGTRWIIEAVLCGTGVRRDVCMELGCRHDAALSPREATWCAWGREPDGPAVKWIRARFARHHRSAEQPRLRGSRGKAMTSVNPAGTLLRGIRVETGAYPPVLGACRHDVGA